MADTLKTISRSAAHFFSGTLLSRITGMLRDVAMAYVFGTQSFVAALLVAFRFAHLLRRLLGEGAMQTALIPHFEELRKESEVTAATFFRDLAFSLTILLTFLIVVIMCFLWGLLEYDVFNVGNAEIAWLTLVMMPSLLFICLFGINASLMQCEKNYFVSSAAPVMFNLIWIVGVFYAGTMPQQTAMTSLSLFIVLACFAQWVVTLPRTYAILVAHGLTRVFKGIKLYSFNVRRLAVPLALGIMGVAAAQVNNALDAVFARWADEEGPALLWYAIRLQQLPLALFGIALSGALLPPLARAIKGENWDQFQQFLDFAFRRTLAFMVPITVALFVFGDSCVAFIYGHGDFTSDSVVGTVKSLWGYAVGLIPMALVLVLAPAFYAKGDYRTPSIVAVWSMALNIALNTIAVAILGLGAASIALATSISAWFNMGWLTFSLRRSTSLQSDHGAFEWLPSALKITGISFIAAVVVILMRSFLWGQISPFEFFWGEVPDYRLPFFVQVFHLAFEGVVFLVMVVVMAKVLKVKDITDLVGLRQRAQAET